MTRIGFWAGALAAAFAVSGAGALAGDDSKASPPPPKIRVSPRAPAATPSAEAPRAAVLVEIARSGGFAGLDERLVVRENGTASLTRRGETSDLKLTAEQVKQVRQAVKAADFGKLKESYLPADPCCDRIETAVTHGGRTVRALENMPAPLKALVDLLVGFIKAPPASAS